MNICTKCYYQQTPLIKREHILVEVVYLINTNYCHIKQSHLYRKLEYWDELKQDDIYLIDKMCGPFILQPNEFSDHSGLSINILQKMQNRESQNDLSDNHTFIRWE
jgi:hypothetical protein